MWDVGAGTVAADQEMCEVGAGTAAAAVSEVGAGTAAAAAVSEVGAGTAAAVLEVGAGTAAAADRKEVWGDIAVAEGLKMDIAEAEELKGGPDIPVAEGEGGGARTLADEDVGLGTAGIGAAEG